MLCGLVKLVGVGVSAAASEACERRIALGCGFVGFVRFVVGFVRVEVDLDMEGVRGHRGRSYSV